VLAEGKKKAKKSQPTRTINGVVNSSALANREQKISGLAVRFSSGPAKK